MSAVVIETTACGRTCNSITQCWRVLVCSCILILCCSLSCFDTDQPSAVFGTKLREQVEERLSFFESGELPRKNIEVMQEAISELEAEKEQLPLTPSTAG